MWQLLEPWTPLKAAQTHLTMNPLCVSYRTLPALQWTTATFLWLFASQRLTSMQNSLMSSMLGGWWSSNGNRWTQPRNREASYVRSEHLTEHNIMLLATFCNLLLVKPATAQLPTVSKCLNHYTFSDPFPPWECTRKCDCFSDICMEKTVKFASYRSITIQENDNNCYNKWLKSLRW